MNKNITFAEFQKIYESNSLNNNELLELAIKIGDHPLGNCARATLQVLNEKEYK